jgi:putative alpha-1,2-mannosidase
VDDQSLLYHGKCFADAGNQVSYSYLFHFAGRPDLSASVSREIFRSRFRPIPDGLSGNADAGAIQSWLLWNMIGLYTVTGQTTFLIHSCWFEHLKINLGNGKELVFNSTGGDKDTSIHAQSVKVNGGDWKNPWLTWDDVFAIRGT